MCVMRRSLAAPGIALASAAPSNRVDAAVRSTEDAARQEGR